MFKKKLEKGKKHHYGWIQAMNRGSVQMLLQNDRYGNRKGGYRKTDGVEQKQEGRSLEIKICSEFIKIF